MRAYFASDTSTIYYIFSIDTPPTRTYSLSLHDALPISQAEVRIDPPEAQRVDLVQRPEFALRIPPAVRERVEFGDRKSTRLNSSHTVISYAVFCLKKKTEPYSLVDYDQDVIRTQVQDNI